MTLENHHFLIGDTSSKGCVTIVMLVFGGVCMSTRCEDGNQCKLCLSTLELFFVDKSCG